MRAINIQQAKTHLSRLVDEAQAGEDIVIAKAGRPCVRLVPVSADDAPRELGRLRGRIFIADDFDAPSPEIEAMFGLGEVEPKRARAKKPARPARRRSSGT
ncbi:MAG: type II toxin-antitoxin system Phd/YefM family antitoxin [Deltaproteobacteria bacterium]|jgi:prevent-host-death family protein